MNPDFLLKNETARRLYENYAKDLPVIDFHNHLSVADIAKDRRYENLTELWLEPDPYKHRLMRICGVDEFYITGGADPDAKFEKFCEIFPDMAGTPVYDWSRMELDRYFGIRELPDKKTAKNIYKTAEKFLKKPKFSTVFLLKTNKIEHQSPVATLDQDLTPYLEVGVSPSLRGDNLLSTEPIPHLQQRLAAFSAAGCRFADHSLDTGFFETGNTEQLIELAGEYAKRGWTLLLHLGALRQTSTRLAQRVGPAGGYAAMGKGVEIERLAALLDEMEQKYALPQTVLFPLNPRDFEALAVLQGSFSGKVQLGPAWWWCDHASGIRQALDCIASYGVLSQFIGMTTDSRSILSFARHDYFRRILCQWISEQDWGQSEEQLGRLIRKICYENAKRRYADV
ncbi:MAG: glucuronate isomerase [Clostridia bacterium]|nr:glucuronate isomerase [Clostridia bacterium]